MLSENKEPEAVHGGTEMISLSAATAMIGWPEARGDDEIYGGAGDDLIAGGGDMYGTGWFIAWHTRALYTGHPDIQRRHGRSGFTFRRRLGVLRTNGRVIRGEIWELRERDDQDGSDTIIAGAGNDEVWAGWGDDYVSGDAGDDTLIGEEGEDTLFGGEDADTIHGDGAQAFGGPDNHGADYIDGEAGDDQLFGWGADDTLFGGAGDDLLAGDDEWLDYAYHGNDYLDGEEGDDLIAGQGGDDQLFGGDGQDELQGGDGDDYMDGEEGADTVFAGDGEDEIYGGFGRRPDSWERAAPITSTAKRAPTACSATAETIRWLADVPRTGCTAMPTRMDCMAATATICWKEERETTCSPAARVTTRSLEERAMTCTRLPPEMGSTR